MPFPHEPLVLGVDLDGVCADYITRMREIAAEWFERDIATFPMDVSYGLAEWGLPTDDNGKQYESLHRFAVLQRDLFRTMPMIPGARKVLRRLSDEGARIRILTHRLYVHYFHQAAVQQTVEWLDRFGIPYWDLCFMRNKAHVGADIYIDDSPLNIEQLRAQGCHTICFANSTNRHIPAPCADSWDAVYALVTARMAALEAKPPLPLE